MNKNNIVPRKITLLGFFIFSILINVSCAQAPNKKELDNDKVSKIDELISLYSDYDGFNGSVLVAHEGKIIYKKGFGLANMEWGIPNQVDTKFRIASVTKPFTALLIMQLVAEKKLDLHEPITTYLPEYPKENGEQITIHHLLTHSSGIIRDYKADEKLNKYPDRQRPEELVRAFSGLPLEFKPGKKFAYSNSGYMVLGYIIETVTHKSYETVLQEKILSPLNMKNTGIDTHRPIIKNRSQGYFKGFGEYFNSDYIDRSAAFAVGYIYSTVEDLFLFDQALYSETLLPKEYMDLALTEHFPASFGGYYGYGWELSKKPIGSSTNTIGTIGHSGAISGYCSIFTRIPSSNSTIILLNNTRRAFLNAITTGVTGILYDESYNFPLKPLAQFMTEAIEKEGIEKGVLFYKNHKDDRNYYSSEKELIVAGYKLLHAGKTKDAAAVFKLSTEVFPERDNPYDSYAEALMALGKNDEAIKNYKKSLELNPKNNNAKNMLKKLGVHADHLEKVTFNLIEIDSTWGKEVFQFPLKFAKDINFEGFEEAVFPKGWINKESPNFWSYAFAWNINLTTELTEDQLENYLKKYYDGLITDVNKDKGLVLPKTIAEIHKSNDSTFTGEVTIYDAFATKEPLKLNIRVSQKYCKQKNKSILLFKVSPKVFDTEMWQTLEEISLFNNICEK